MTRFKSILCASLLTLAVSAPAFAGEITGKAKLSTSSSLTVSVMRPGEITGKKGEITGLVETILGLIAMLP